MDPFNWGRGLLSFSAGALGWASRAGAEGGRPPPPRPTSRWCPSSSRGRAGRPRMGRLPRRVRGRPDPRAGERIPGEAGLQGGRLRSRRATPLRDRPEALRGGALAQAQGVLGQAQAQLGKAELDVARFTPLANRQGDQPGGARRRRPGPRSRPRPRCVGPWPPSTRPSSTSSFTMSSRPIDGVAGLVIRRRSATWWGRPRASSRPSPSRPHQGLLPDQRAGLPRIPREGFPRAPEHPGRDGEFDLILSDGSTYPRGREPSSRSTARWTPTPGRSASWPCSPTRTGS
jgi:hypothetical protein